MLGMETTVDIGSGNPVECSRRLLSAINGGNQQSLQRELARAARVSGTQVSGPHSSLLEEQRELLGAIVERMQQYEPCAEAEIFLLGHLARATT
jgi:hypothetical protein